MKFWGLTCPKWLMPHVLAKETGDAEKLHFQVAAALPLIGVVVSYSGYLEVGSKAQP